MVTVSMNDTILLYMRKFILTRSDAPLCLRPIEESPAP
jgi:hypothetical protein